MFVIKRKLIAGPVDEQLLITKKYFFDSGGNIEHILTLLNRVDIPLTEGTRQFIAGVFSGRTTTKSRKIKKNYFRDLNIYWSISELMEQGENLTSNKNPDTEGAASKIAGYWRISEDAAIKIFQRMKPKFNPEDYI